MKRGKILYVGYDPDENDFTDCELAPLHDDDDKPTALNIERAFELQASGKSLKQIGAILAREMGRPQAYHANSVWMAMKGVRLRNTRARQ